MLICFATHWPDDAALAFTTKVLCNTVVLTLQVMRIDQAGNALVCAPFLHTRWVM